MTPILLFGASNLTLGWDAVIRSLCATVSGPINLNVCLGMGRSWIGHSRFGFRVLPGITQCALWNNLPETSATPFVLMTDVGNDIVYGHDVQRIADTVQLCIDRLRTWNANVRIVLTQLPMASLNSVGRIRFEVARRILFPTLRLTYSRMKSDALELSDRISRIAASNGLPLIIPEADWYGLDPIHIVKSSRYFAFRHFWSHWNIPASTCPAESYLPPLPVTAEQIRYGRPVTTPQPVWRSDRIQVSAW